MNIRAERMLDGRLIRYGLASIGALAVDMAAFAALIALAVAPAPAAALGYCAGIIAHWLLSSRAVFQDSVAHRGPARTRQKALFVLSALVGLALTTLIVAIGTQLGMMPYIAKAIAIAASFVATWLMRSKIVFRDAAI